MNDTINYMIIGGVQHGTTTHVLRTLSLIAKAYNARVIHAGPLVTREEKNMYDRRQLRCKTWEKIQYKEKTRLNEYNFNQKSLRFQQDEQEMLALKKACHKRIEDLQSHFGEVIFVCTEEQTILKPESYVDNYFRASKDIGISAIPAAGDKVSHNPLTDYVGEMVSTWADGSHIFPHAIPASKVIPTPEDGHVRWFATTGGLMHPPKIQTTAQRYMINHQAGCIILTVDKKTQRGVTTQVILDTTTNYSQTAVDGMFFHSDADKLKEVPRKDKCAVIGDTHYPYENKLHIWTFGEYFGMTKPDTLVHLSDASDYDPVSRHNKGKRKHQENKRVIDIFKGLIRMTKELERKHKFKKKTMLRSNHGEWLTDYVAENPELIGLCDWDTVSKTYLPSWTVKEGKRGRTKFGDFYFRHGHEDKLKRANLIFRKVIQGHSHSPETYKHSVTLASSCRFDLSYLQDNVTGWQLQFAEIYRIKTKSYCTVKWPRYDHSKNTAIVPYRGKLIKLKR